MISTVPTLLQRQGQFTEPIAGRVPLIYDPRSTVVVGTGVTRSQFSGNAIPADRIDSVARVLLERYPPPTSAGTANNYRRVGNEKVDQDQISVRVDHRFAGNRDQLGRLSRFQEDFVPVTPLPDGSGTTTGTLGPQDTKSWSFASSYQRTLSSPTGLFTFSNLFTSLPTDATTAANTGAPLASFLLGQVQLFSIDLQQAEIRNRASFQEYFIQDDWRVSNRFEVSAGLRYTLNSPSTEKNNQAAVFNLETRQLEYLGRNGQPRAARQLHGFNFGPRTGIVGRVTDKTVMRTGYRLVWIEMAGITSPFTTPVFPFLQTVSQRTLDNITPAFTLSSGPNVQPIPLMPDAGLGQGVFSVDRDLGSGYVQQWNASLQRELEPDIAVEVAYVGSKITRVGLPDTNLNPFRLQIVSTAGWSEITRPVTSRTCSWRRPYGTSRSVETGVVVPPAFWVQSSTTGRRPAW